MNDRMKTDTVSVLLPTQGRAEREHLYLWIQGEEEYVAGKFDDQRPSHDEAMRDCHLELEGFWFRQIVQYYDRARLFFNEALGMEEGDPGRRDMEMRGQQALAKAMMTAKGCVESSIRVYGSLPKPGVTSGEVEAWT